MAKESLSRCPLCGSFPIRNDVCPGSCGSLEGLLRKDCVKTTRIFGYDWANGFVAPFLGIAEQAARKALVAAKLGMDDTVVDLGCGDGRICRVACLLGANAVGYDLDKELIKKANLLAFQMTGCTNKPNFHVADLFAVELDTFSVVVMFLLPDIMERLVPKLLMKFERKNRRIITFGWPVPGLGEPTTCYKEMQKSDDAGVNSCRLIDRWYIYEN
eukprot:CAMPEP_0194249304 /NCGR_PEP_ID=MMETSP0158-20130606/20187_1 /TAXON_ID=33649 /ORGANISM="Thalassionema nitzschioides, Strain L26-B" /LENGTH=214 /DNA_ID=CAMNT_0038985795 /DNA_START=81 /DNA_END=722 /DNA_ORIENTATION=-